ncbi:MAG: hypothetical protein M3161_00365, partial [Actinomycetota bacterium]|nr:hypothetical protein [Actinomycetota bacterium]
ATHLAYEESVSHFARALNALDLKESEDDHLRCELLLCLGDAQWRAGDGSSSRETFKRAAEVARRLQDGEKLARAALGYGGGVGRFGLQELADPALVELLEQALAWLGQDGALKVRLLARLAVELYYSDTVERRLALSEEAVELARRHGDRSVELVALYSLHWATLGPDRLEERLSASAQIAALAREIGDKEMAFRGHHLRLITVLELGDVAAVDAELHACRELATEMQQPIYIRQIKRLDAMRALLHGDFERSERLAFDVGGTRNSVDQSALSFYGARMGVQFWAQGRVDELLPAARTLAQQNPWNPTWRVTVAFFASELGREGEARAEFERFAAEDFRNIPRDWGWLGCLYLLALVCAALNDRQRAPILYDLLLPYEHRSTVLAAGAASLGSVATALGVLALTMRRHDDAACHFDTALEHNRAIDAKPLVALTQYWYARMLVDRASEGDHEKARLLLDEAIDLTQKLGMKKLMQQGLEFKMETASSEPVRVDELPGM